MNANSVCTMLLLGAFTTSLSAQTILSDFNGPTADGWTGSIVTITPFANGFTAATGVDVGGNGVLNLSDGGFGGGALRTYSGLPTTGFVTFTVFGRIDTDPGTLNPDPNSNPGTFGSSFGLAAGSTGIAEQGFGYSPSLSTMADDSGQAFALYAVTARADGSGDFTAFFTPDQHDSAVGGGTWVAQFDNVSLHDLPVTETVLSDFAAGTDGWAAIDATNSPFTSTFSTVAAVGGELSIADAGFAGGAFNTYTAAAAGAGVHTVLVDVRIVTDNLTVDRARIAAVAGGPTLDYWDLAFSQSFATAGDDTGQTVQTVAVPVITTGASDVTVYVIPDYDAAIGSGAYEIAIDNVRIASPNSPMASTTFSSTCAAGHHSAGGPVLGFTGLPVIGSSFDITAGNLTGAGLAGLIIGGEIAPVSLDTYGSFPGSQVCIQSIATAIVAPGPSAAFTVTLPFDPGLLGLPVDVQWFDYDPTMAFAIPIGTSQAGRFTVGL